LERESFSLGEPVSIKLDEILFGKSGKIANGS